MKDRQAEQTGGARITETSKTVCVYVCVCLAECHGSCHPGQITILTHLGSNPSGRLIKPLFCLVTHTHSLTHPTHSECALTKSSSVPLSLTHTCILVLPHTVIPSNANTQISRQLSNMTKRRLHLLS